MAFWIKFLATRGTDADIGLLFRNIVSGPEGVAQAKIGALLLEDSDFQFEAGGVNGSMD